jgi:hypothetical protein
MNMKSRRVRRSTAALICGLVTLIFALAGIPALAENIGQAAQTNTRPIAENLTLETFRNIALSGRFKAVDLEGDAVTFEVIDKPTKGTVTAGEDGSFTYAPLEGKKGRDTFTYIAYDDYGGLSDKAVVTINIGKQSTDISYADMAGNASHYSSLVLAEKGIFTGDKIGGAHFFRPASTVTRGEFLAMCLAMTKTETIKDIIRTGFYDDDSIPVWVKPYVSAALMSGVITGYKDVDGRLIFNANDPVTASEAAVILDNLLQPTDVSVSAEVLAHEEGICPAWAYQAEANLASCNILPAGADCGRCLTRAEAADMLVAAMNLIESRDHNKSLLSWAQF